MPAIRIVWLVHHAFLNRSDARFFVRERPITSRSGDTLAAIVVVREFVRDAHASKVVIPIRAVVTEPAMGHIPTMQARTIRQSSVPAIEIQTTDRPIMIDLVK